jgi:DNA-binding NarL/FixJ family response regulator
MTASPDSPLRVALGENHPDLATTLAMLIDLQPDMACVGHGATAQAVLELAEKAAPQAYVLDLMLDDGSSIPLIRLLRERNAAALIGAFSGLDDPRLAEQCALAGCDATLAKDGQIAPLLQTLRRLRSTPGPGRNLDTAQASKPMPPATPGTP